MITTFQTDWQNETPFWEYGSQFDAINTNASTNLDNQLVLTCPNSNPVINASYVRHQCGKNGIHDQQRSLSCATIPDGVQLDPTTSRWTAYSDVNKSNLDARLSC